MSQLRQIESEFESRQIQVVVVTFDGESLARQYQKQFKLNWPLLIDSSFDLYRAYGMPKASIWTLIKPSVMFKYVRNIVTGSLPGKPGRDLRQLGGNVLIDPDGNVRMHHVCKDPHDRPSAKDVFRIVDEN